MKSLLSILKITISLGSVLLVVVLLSRSIRLQDLSHLWVQIEWPILLNCVLLIVGGMAIKGLRLFHLLAHLPMSQPLIKCLNIQIVSISMGMFTPGRSGELIKIYLLANHQKSWIGGTTLLCLFERLLDLAVLTAFSLSLCVMVLTDQRITWALVVFGLILAVASMLLIRADRLLHLIPALHHYMPDDFATYRSALFDSAPLTLAYTALAWVMDGMLQWHILAATGFTYPLLIIIGINAIVTIMGILSILPIGLGTTDLSALFLYVSLLHVPHSAIVFLLWAGRLIGLPVLLLLFILALFSDKSLWLGLRKQQ